MTKSLILFIFLLKSCAFNNGEIKEKEMDMKTEFFEDVNLFTLKGVRKIENSPAYPYIEIEYINDTERNIIYHGSKDMVYRREYKRLNDFWETSFTTSGDTCSIITYEYIMPNKVIDLYYCYNNNITDTVLTDVSVFEGSTETIYDMGNEIYVKPGINVADFAKAKSRSVFTKEISIKDGVLSMKERKKDNTNKVVFEETNCYELGNHSYFWWRYFGWTIEKIDCR